MLKISKLFNFFKFTKEIKSNIENFDLGDILWCDKCRNFHKVKTFCQNPTAFEFIKALSDKCGGFHSTERAPDKVTNSEMKRWFQKQSIHINGKSIDATSIIDLDTITSVVLFPKSKSNRITLF